MRGNNDQQSRQTQILPHRTRSSRQSSATGYEDMDRSHATHSASGSRRLLNWSINRIIRELRKHAADAEDLEDSHLRQREKLNQQEATLQKLREALAQASKTISDQERKHAELQFKHTELQRRYAELQRAHADEKRAHAQEQQAHAETKRAHAEHSREYERETSVLKAEVYQLEKEKASSRAVANSTKISDNVILDLWKRMAYNIRALANTVLTRCPGEEELELDYRQNKDLALKTKSAEYKLLTDESTRSAVVEHYIWRSIASGIFGCGQQRYQFGAWGGIAGNTLCALSRLLLPKIKATTAAEFFLWRSQGAAIVERAAASQSQQLVELATQENRRLSILLPPAKRGDKAARCALQTELLSIFGDATELHSIFMKSRAYFHIAWAQQTSPSSQGLPYNPETMESEIWGDTKGVQSVLLNISPGLSKAGTADGVDYDRTALLVKPRVVCG